MRYFCALAIFVVLLLAACSPLRNAPATPSPATPPQPAANFAFSFAFGTCNTDVLDTFEHTYTREIDFEESVSIPVTLTETQLAAIYRKMVQINFFHYPEVFQIPVREGETVGMVTPAPSYRFTVRSGEVTKTVTWTDEIIDPNSPEADALRELIQVLMQVIESHPDIQALPRSNRLCA